MKEYRRVLLALLTCISLAAPLRADGGMLRISKKVNGLVISAFTSPTPACVGTIDVSILIQDERTGTAILDGDVTIVARRGNSTHAAAATAETATNRMMRAAQIDLRDAGRWSFEIDFQKDQSESRIAFDLDVEPAAPRWRELLPWIVWPFGAILVFGILQRGERRFESVTAESVERP